MTDKCVFVATDDPGVRFFAGAIPIHGAPIWVSPECHSRDRALSAETLARINEGRKKYYSKGLGTCEGLSPQRYIQTSRKVFQFENLEAAERALPRFVRTDPKSRLVSEDEEFSLLKETPANLVVYPTASTPRK